MPLYEYLCEACGERTEFLQRFADAPEVTCPKCGGAMRKLPSAPSFQFKGSGFYQTDYARKAGEKEGSSGRGEADKGGDNSGKVAADGADSKSADSGAGAGKSVSPGEVSAAGRDGGPNPSKDTASASPTPAAPTTPTTPTGPADRKPVPSGGE